MGDMPRGARRCRPFAETNDFAHETNRTITLRRAGVRYPCAKTSRAHIEVSVGSATPVGMAVIGYARVSTRDQHDALQQDALQQAGCARIFTDVASGAHSERAALQEALEFLREGDTLVVWRLDRLGRSLRHLLELSEHLESRGIQLRSLTEHLDTSSPGGRLIFGLMSALAQFERDLIRERTHAGLQAARDRGRTGGRPSVMTPAKASAALRLHRAGTPISHIADSLEVSRATIYRWLAKESA